MDVAEKLRDYIEKKDSGAIGFLMEYLPREQKKEVLEWRDEMGNSLLHYAAENGMLMVADMFAEVNIQNKEGLTPLDVAVLRRDSKMARLLIYKGGIPSVYAKELAALGLAPEFEEFWELVRYCRETFEEIKGYPLQVGAADSAVYFGRKKKIAIEINKGVLFGYAHEVGHILHREGCWVAPAVAYVPDNVEIREEWWKEIHADLWAAAILLDIGKDPVEEARKSLLIPEVVQEDTTTHPGTTLRLEIMQRFVKSIREPVECTI